MIKVKRTGYGQFFFCEQMRQNRTWQEAANALYKGSNSNNVIRTQDMALYMRAVRHATDGDIQTLRIQLKALDNINKLASKGAPNKALKAAYNELLDKVQLGQEKQIAKAAEVAINEKSRYVAERITRTEMARAWADGFWAKAQNSNDIVAVKFKLSSRHPVFDICDMYSKADMFGLGAGVFPKNKVPALPIHPHCLCRYVEVYTDEVDLNKQRDNIRASGDEWLENLSDLRKRQVLGYDGLKAWQNGEDWRKYMRGYAGLHNPSTRLQNYFKDDTINNMNSENQRYGRNKNTVINHKYIASAEYKRKFDKITDNKELSRILYSTAKEMLNHRSGTLFEDMYWLDLDTNKIIASVTDATDEKKICYTSAILKAIQGKRVLTMHTHPDSFPPSDADFRSAYVHKYYKNLVLCHDGTIFAYNAHSDVNAKLYIMYVAKFKKNGYNEHEAQIKALNMLKKMGGISFEEV